MENTLALEQFAALQLHPDVILTTKGHVALTPEYIRRVFELPLDGEEDIPAATDEEMEVYFGAKGIAKEYKISAHNDPVARTHMRFLVEMVMLTHK